MALRELAARKALASRESTCTRMAAPSHCRRYLWLPQERLRPTAWAHNQTLPSIRICVDFFVEAVGRESGAVARDYRLLLALAYRVRTLYYDAFEGRKGRQEGQFG